MPPPPDRGRGHGSRRWEESKLLAVWLAHSRRGRTALAALPAAGTTLRADPLHRAFADRRFLGHRVDHQPGHLADPAMAAAPLATVVAGIAAAARAGTVAIAAPLAATTGAGNADLFAAARVLMLDHRLRGAVHVADGDEAAAATGTALAAAAALVTAVAGAAGRRAAGRRAQVAAAQVVGAQAVGPQVVGPHVCRPQVAGPQGACPKAGTLPSRASPINPIRYFFMTMVSFRNL